MSGKLKRFRYWLSRRSSLPVWLIGGAVIVVLCLNDDISLSMSRKYDKEIIDLKTQIQSNRDSAQYYRQKREAIVGGGSDLERMAREQYHMQRPTEDVFLIKE